LTTPTLLISITQINKKGGFIMKYFIILSCFLIITCITVSAQIIHVPGDQPTIQAGIDAAQNGDMVLVDDGTYLENINFKGKAITVASNFIMNGDTSHRNNTIIDGSQPTHPDSGSVVYFISGEDTTSVLYGFTITGGTGTVSFVGAPRLARSGGGIFITDVGAKISHNYIFNNSVADSFAVVGGGLAAGAPWSTSFVIIEDNIFDSNSCLRSVFVSQGGGMSITTKARVCNNIFSNNVVSSDSGEAFGGGFVASYNLDSVLIYNNLIINNKVETGIITNPIMDRALGGGFVLWNDSTAFIRMIGNVIAYNEVSSSNYTVGAGGYFEHTNGDVIFDNNLLYGNHYSGSVSCYGSALNMRKAKVSIINNTITGNEPSINGALSTDLDDSSLLMNNILWGNSTGPSMPEIDIWTGSPPEIVYCDVEGGWTGMGNINLNPELMDTVLTTGDTLFAILSIGSPCIDTGNPDTMFNDPEDPNNLGYALWPSMGTISNDMGAYGGPGAISLITDVDDDRELINDIPVGFQLNQNYPNPFNPSTTIEFALPTPGFVTLSVYNILGEKVATLVSEELAAGSYKYEWDATELTSGIYFYSLSAGEFVSTKKMILMK
jgi:hypothetical protein